MNAFGAGGLFAAFLLGGFIVTLKYGPVGFVAVCLMVFCCLWILSVANRTFRADGSFKPRKGRQKRR